ncbi:hypothetical protein GCM10010464_88750 [Pseudonocardia yunnanensis]
MLPPLRELEIGHVAYSPLGHGFLTGTVRSPAHLDDSDFRSSNPRFAEEDLRRDLALWDRASDPAPCVRLAARFVIGDPFDEPKLTQAVGYRVDTEHQRPLGRHTELASQTPPTQ